MFPLSPQIGISSRSSDLLCASSRNDRVFLVCHPSLAPIGRPNSSRRNQTRPPVGFTSGGGGVGVGGGGGNRKELVAEANEGCPAREDIPRVFRIRKTFPRVACLVSRSIRRTIRIERSMFL